MLKVKRLHVAVLVFFALTRAGARADTANCVFISGGAIKSSPFAAFRRGDEALVYRLNSTSSRWLIEDFGYHATAIVRCRDCSAVSSKVVGAVIWLTAGPRLPAKPEVVPGQQMPAAAFIPWFETRLGHATIRKVPEAIASGRFRGWLLAMDAIAHGDITHRIFEVEASDGCAFMRVRMELPPSSTGKSDDVVYDLLRSLQVSVTDARFDPLWPDLKRHFTRPSQSKKITFDEFRKAIGAEE